ncbi:hypothetical protein F4781DRAFT_441254 [Annulohypoxylon bovei var. microspora]|nr:hypothetical protein F4781DRAFT_441254 [Annulohypoxylon bovei var. microspora]
MGSKIHSQTPAAIELVDHQTVGPARTELDYVIQHPHWHYCQEQSGPMQVPIIKERTKHIPITGYQHSGSPLSLSYGPPQGMPQFYYPPPTLLSPPIPPPPPPPPCFLPPLGYPLRQNPVYSPHAVEATGFKSSWDLSNPKTPPNPFPRGDKVDIPKLYSRSALGPPSYAPSAATLKTQELEEVKQKESPGFYQHFKRVKLVDTFEDPFLDDDSDSSSYSNDSGDSDDSDSTITPQSYAASVRHARYKLSQLTLKSKSGTFKHMAPNHAFKNGAMDSRAVAAGPDLGTIKVGHQYICECHISRMFAEKRLDPAREANYRLQGIQVIESTREALFLPVKTYNTACTLYHRFRLDHPTPDYNYTDAALASLFVACKIEDTLKKSREVLCAQHNLKNPDHPTTQDDKIFDQPSKVLIGIERYMVEAINFDFRVRYPQKILAKIAKKVLGPSADLSGFFPTALKMSIDLYMTYAPLKQSSYTCAVVIVQLTALITGQFVDEFRSIDPTEWHTDDQCVAEVMLDLLDLYTQHGKATKVGPQFDLQVFIDVQIRVNQYVENAGLSRYVNQCRECQSTIPPPTPSSDSPMSLNTPSAAGTSTIKRGLKGADGGTTRFVFDADEAVREKTAYNEYTMDEFEEWEEEFEEPIPDSREDRRHEPRGPRGPRGHGHGRGHGRGGFDPGWTPRNRHDRRRRGGGFY